MDLNQRGVRNPFRFNFTLLDDRRTVNAFALPGGQIFLTEALYSQLSASQVAGVLGHEIGHVVERHSSEQMAKGNLIRGLVSAAGVAGAGPFGPGQQVSLNLTTSAAGQVFSAVNLSLIHISEPTRPY